MRLFTAIFLLIFINTAKAQLNLGVGMSVIAENTLIGPQIKLGYQASEKISLVGGFSYYFKKQNTFGIDADVHFKIINISDVKVSPLAGINIRQINSNINTGLQVGFFIEIPKNSYHLYIEPKAILDDNTVIALAGGFFF